MVCDVCFQPNRRTRFCSARLEICQWCINEIANADRSPNVILFCQRLTFQENRRNQIKREIFHLERQIKPAPVLDQVRVSQVDAIAMSIARQEEGFLTSLYRSFVNESDRLSRARAIGEKLLSKIISEHSEATASHAAQQRELLANIAKLESRLSNVESDAAEDMDSYLAEVLASSPTNSKDTRLLRARALGLVNEERELTARPADQEFEAIKHSIRAQDGYKCVCCGKSMSTAELHVHHIIPLYKFGTNNKNNLVTLCYSCHNKQHPDFTVSRNQPIRRKRTVGKKKDADQTVRLVHKNQVQVAIPRSRKGWMDCPECLSSIKLTEGTMPECPECGWQPQTD